MHNFMHIFNCISLLGRTLSTSDSLKNIYFQKVKCPNVWKKRSGLHQVVFIHCIICVWLSINSYPRQTLTQSTEIGILITLNSIIFVHKHCTSFFSLSLSLFFFTLFYILLSWLWRKEILNTYVPLHLLILNSLSNWNPSISI